MIYESIMVTILLMIIIFSKLCIDKKTYLKHLQKKNFSEQSLSSDKIFDICKARIKEGERLLCEYSGKRIHIVWAPSSKKPNASASIPFMIIFTGDWSFLADKKDASKAYLLHTIGHELAHKDNEPVYSFRSFSCNMKNHVREMRADFCGLSFAMNYFNDRDLIIQSKYEYKNIEHSYKKTDHPSDILRKKCMETYKRFSIAVIEEIVKAKEYSDVNERTGSSEYIERLERKCYNGHIFREGTF